jgi:hypothetical protein
VALGRWDEAADVIEHALELSPTPGPRAVLLQLAGDVALARGDLPGAAELAAASHGALAGFGYRDQHHLPLVRLEAELYLAQDRAGDALAVAQQELDGFDLQSSPRYAWPCSMFAELFTRPDDALEADERRRLRRARRSRQLRTVSAVRGKAGVAPTVLAGQRAL